MNELTDERREQVARERARLYAGEQLGTAGEDREFLLHLVEVERERTRKANEAWADEDQVRHEVEAELEYVTRERDAALRTTAHVLQMCDDALPGSVWLSIEAIRATLAEDDDIGEGSTVNGESVDEQGTWQWWNEPQDEPTASKLTSGPWTDASLRLPWPHPALGPLPDSPVGGCYICIRHSGDPWHSDGGHEAYVEHCDEWHDGELG